MSLTHFGIDIDKDGIALITWDMAGKSMNVIDAEVMDDLDSIAAMLESDDRITGAVFTSGKETFSGGADLSGLQGSLKSYHAGRGKDPEGAMQRLFDESRRLTLIYRRLETCGKPLVCAINGTCMGGAFELALACHARIAAANPKARMGLPEVKIGLFPGAGGTQRVARMLPVADALQFLLKGQALTPERALAMKLVDEVVPPARLVGAAKKRIKTAARAAQPWDEDNFRLPGGPVYSKAGMMTFPAANAIYRRETYDNYPGARAILTCVYEGLQVPMDTALTIESRQFAHVLQTPEAAHMIRSMFLSMQALNKGARRPKDVAPSKLKTVGIVGAGFMGAGIAHVTAQAGLQVMLIDQSLEAAEKGKAHADSLLSKAVSQNRIGEKQKEAILSRIRTGTDHAALKTCDLVIEAVFEDRAVKKDVLESVGAAIKPSCILASNTSTLPITSLAEYGGRPEDFIGIHFFSPVEKMMLVEIIMGEKTGDEALAMALDYVRAIRKTPIVVNDSRGFYTSRVVVTYLREGHLMLSEGVPAAMVENVARMAGMPVGPLALTDEVAVDLAWKILQATKKDLGEDAVDARQHDLLQKMVVRRKRYGRKNSKGFYDYPSQGKKHLWPGLADLVEPHPDPESIDIDELKQRFLVMQALETARCFEEGVLTDVREADVGSILGFGFAPFTGGTLSYIDGMGTKAFVETCKQLAKVHGDRFEPNGLLTDMAKRNEGFYTRFAPEQPGGEQAA